MEYKYSVDTERMDAEIDAYEPDTIKRDALKRRVHDALIAIDETPIAVAKFIRPQPSKLDIARMGITRFVVAAIPIAIGAGVAAIAGAPAGIAAGTLAAATVGVSKAKKEIRKSTGSDPGVWDIVGRIINNIFELIRKITKPKNGG